MNVEDLKPNVIVHGPMFPEPLKVISVVPMGGSIKLSGQGMTTGLLHQSILSPAQLVSLEGSPEQQPFDGDAPKSKVGVEALSGTDERRWSEGVLARKKGLGL